MAHTLALLSAALVVAAGRVDVQFTSVAPARPDAVFVRSVGQRRAVLLIHGFRPYPFNEKNAHKATLHAWQKPGSKLVRTLGRDADVYAFAYSQNAPVDEIADDPSLREGIGQLRGLGYTEIVLVAYSAGGLIGRQFVEDHPDAGVTKVIQVCAPNAGTTWANLGPMVLRGQEEFIHSLSKDARRPALERRAGKPIPANVQFVCIVGTGEFIGDGLVSCASQWPEDLQAQGIPAVGVFATHVLMMWNDTAIKRIAALSRGGIPRWGRDQVAAARHRLLLIPESHAAAIGPVPAFR